MIDHDANEVSTSLYSIDYERVPRKCYTQRRSRRRTAAFYGTVIAFGVPGSFALDPFSDKQDRFM